jgi:hypothetical protein
MSDIKKKQHYVWRNYLRSWAEDENIYTYFKESKKTIFTNLVNVAQERFFYKLVDFTEDEEIFIRSFVEKNSHPAVKELNLKLFKILTINGTVKKMLVDDNYILLENKDVVDERIRKFDINLMEDVHTKIESYGEKLINYRSLEELKTILIDSYYFNGLIFLCVQYFRTKKMKKAFLKECKDRSHELVMEKSWNIISYTFASTMAVNIASNESLKFTFIENKTSNYFMTGDQPVFNLFGDELDDKGNVYRTELYYPLTPHCALIIHFRKDQKNQFESKDADNEMINYLNKKVFENSDFYVFAYSEEQFDKFEE